MRRRKVEDRGVSGRKVNKMIHRLLLLLVWVVLMAVSQAARVVENDSLIKLYDKQEISLGISQDTEPGNIVVEFMSSEEANLTEAATTPTATTATVTTATPNKTTIPPSEPPHTTTTTPPTTTTTTSTTTTVSTTTTTTSPTTSTTQPTTTSADISNCGAVIDGELASEGVITTPDYPDQYENGLYCVWTILGGKGKRVRLTFDDFEVTKTPGCNGDYLLVSPTGFSNDTTAIHLCGTDIPGEFLSAKDTLYVEFRSTPDGDTCRGFSARYFLEEVVVTCGEEVSFLEFDFENSEYPLPTKNESSHCELTISHDCDVPICQVRLDFLELMLQPPEYGNCDNDQFMVRANEPVPILCGDNTGQHLYVEVAGRASTSLHVLISEILPKPVGHVVDHVTGDTYPLEWRHEVEDNRRWKVRVNQIPCDCTYDHFKTSRSRAPTGCLQYHVGVRETIKSFNFGGSKLDYNPCWNGTEKACGRRMWTGHLNNLDYHVCVHGAEGYCGIMYTPTGTESFMLTGEASYNGTQEKDNLYGSTGCQADYVMVPKSRTPGDNDPWSHDRFCGMALGNYVKGPIVSYSTPFYMQVKTDSDEYSRSVDLENRGFELEYTQLPCSGPYLFNSDQKFSG